MSTWKQQVEDFKKGMAAEELVMSDSVLRVGFFGSVGSGKSVTAGICAIGITSKTGLIGWIDGEGKRSGYASDVICDMAVKKYGGTKDQWLKRFKVIHVDPPFHPLRVLAAIETLEEAGCETIIADILTQAWDSDGGYLDLKNEEIDKMLTANRNTSESKVASSAAAHIKPWTHGKLVSKVTSSKAKLVLLFQAKQKYNAKSFKPDDFETPIQESGLTRTAVAVARVEQDGAGVGGICSFQLPSGHGTKFTHPGLMAVLPKNGQRFTFDHAEAIAIWASSGTKSAPQAAKKTEPIDTRLFSRADIKHRIWERAKPHFGGSVELFQVWLEKNSILASGESLSSISDQRINDVCAYVENELDAKW